MYQREGLLPLLLLLLLLPEVRLEEVWNLLALKGGRGFRSRRLWYKKRKSRSQVAKKDKVRFRIEDAVSYAERRASFTNTICTDSQ